MSHVVVIAQGGDAVLLQESIHMCVIPTLVRNLMPSGVGNRNVHSHAKLSSGGATGHRQLPGVSSATRRNVHAAASWSNSG
eukprot:8076820-Pyramimonas_sp.AAC.1